MNVIGFLRNAWRMLEGPDTGGEGGSGQGKYIGLADEETATVLQESEARTEQMAQELDKPISKGGKDNIKQIDYMKDIDTKDSAKTRKGNNYENGKPLPGKNAGVER